MLYILSFAALLGPLVFIHELGHYLFAKLFNVRVDAFSMGFGPKIFKKKKGETEYCLSLIPLGGYVKLLGQDPSEVIPPELTKRTLNYQKPWKKFLIFLGGPLFNFLMAIGIFASMMFWGEPHATTLVERVPVNTQASVVGFKTGDIITAVGNEAVNKYESVMKIISDSPNKELVFRVKRENKSLELKAVPHPAAGYSIYGESIQVGTIDGLLVPGRHPVVGISDPASAAAKAGLKTGDEIISINGKNIDSYEALENEFQQIKNSKENIVLKSIAHEPAYWLNDKKLETNQKNAVEISLPSQSLEKLGINSSELFILSLVKGSPAESNGLIVGDRLISVEGKTLNSFSELREMVQKAGENKGKFTIEFERYGKIIKKEITPSFNEVKDHLGQSVKQYMIGIFPLFIQREPVMFIEKIWNPFIVASESFNRAIDLSAKTFISLKKLATREVSMGTLGGPLLIGKLAGDSMERGFTYFLRVMALISISLAVFNVLPVPILDGGHIVILFIEVIRGKPFSLKQSEMVQQVGLTLILLLLVVVMFNDISRVGIPAIKTMLE